MCEPEKLAIVDERAAFEAQVARNHGLHLIEDELLRHAAEEANASSRPSISVAMSWRE